MFAHLFKRHIPLTKLVSDRIDRHTHILFGVDDGAPDLAESLRIIAQLRKLGFTGAWCTPHINASTPQNTPQHLRQRFNELTQALGEDTFSLHLAAEYMIDSQFEHIIKDEEVLSHDDYHLLVEFPQYILPGTWKDLIAAIVDRGYTPVLAHPERYTRILSPEEISEIHAMGVVFQGNIGSLSGIYGHHVKEIAEHFRKQGLYQWWGTDVHNARMLGKLIVKA